MLNEHSKTRGNEFKALLDKLIINDLKKLQQMVMDDNEILKMASNARVSKYELVDVLYDMLSEFQDIAGYKPGRYEDANSAPIRKPMFYKFCDEVLKGMQEK